MSCFSHYHGEILVIYPQDRRIDEDTARLLYTEIKELVLGAKHAKVLINFENVTFMGSEMLGSIVRINKLCRTDSIRLKFCGFAKVVQEVIKLSGLDRLLSTHATEAEAIPAFDNQDKGWFG